VPHSDLSIVANNSDNRYGADKKRISIATARTIALRKARLPVRASAQVLAERRACLQGSACLRFRAWAPWLQLDG
jgi:hypothetical protein